LIQFGVIVVPDVVVERIYDERAGPVLGEDGRPALGGEALEIPSARL
jgi:hypothetical protein